MMITGINLNCDGRAHTINGHRVHIQTRCDGRILEIWAWRGERQGDAHAYLRGSSFFDDDSADKNRAYFDRVVTANLSFSA
jgi:hypothetical protein